VCNYIICKDERDVMMLVRLRNSGGRDEAKGYEPESSIDILPFAMHVSYIHFIACRTKDPHDQTLRSRIEDSTEITLPLLGFDECISSLAPPSIHRQLLELYPIIHYFVIRAVRIPPTTA
jgi:hypothetical protein